MRYRMEGAGSWLLIEDPPAVPVSVGKKLCLAQIGLLTQGDTFDWSAIAFLQGDILWFLSHRMPDN